MVWPVLSTPTGNKKVFLLGKQIERCNGTMKKPVTPLLYQFKITINTDYKRVSYFFRKTDIE
jgi:hypothetical protein